MISTNILIELGIIYTHLKYYYTPKKIPVELHANAYDGCPGGSGTQNIGFYGDIALISG
jgi:hypothetical protein